MNAKTFAVCTLGCKVNAYESDCLSAMFEKAGLTRVSFDDAADIYLVNTCSVTNTGDKKSRQAIRRARRTNPDAFIAVLGCYAQADPDAVKRSGADLVAGTSDRERLVSLALSGKRELLVRDIGAVREFEALPDGGAPDRTRAYIKIQDGCNNFCTYCIIPYTRGRVRSRDFADAVAEAKRRVEQGFCEIVLTGIEVYSYGSDLGNVTLLDLIRAIDREASPSRIRLSSIDPRAFTDDFIAALPDISSLCHHFHIAAQSGSTATLRRMGRPVSAEDFLLITKKLRAALPDVGITTDIITGFPGETEEEFSQTRAFVREAAFSRLHVFPYSERRGTKAAAMEQLPVPLREARARLLIEDGKLLMRDFAGRFSDKELLVLFEQGKNGVYEGYSDNYIRVFAESDTDLSGRIVSVRAGKVTGDGALIASVIDNG